MQREYDNYSALGKDPTCDVCGKYIQEGDKVKQTFIGEVKPIWSDGVDHKELGVTEDSYTLIHTDCENWIKDNESKVNQMTLEAIKNRIQEIK